MDIFRIYSNYDKEWEEIDYIVRSMTEDIAKVVLGWKYESPQDLYNSEVTKENIVELMEQGYLGVVNENNQAVANFKLVMIKNSNT
ncbi:MAG TPA: hypothetical protein VNM69_12685 [Bacillus sp. (in: firmicutes)]|uniref:hypothetical protein n=1 Tax=Bacillus litorisediminis TaxID=2922713 RepID=UPI001FACD629|nr:hypothetical protein [Bacillus litorisediminis]HWO76738.1 hypothetical protein [Bacillus sp. (in: firmicutes)]